MAAVYGKKRWAGTKGNEGGYYIYGPSWPCCFESWDSHIVWHCL